LLRPGSDGSARGSGSGSGSGCLSNEVCRVRFYIKVTTMYASFDIVYTKLTNVVAVLDAGCVPERTYPVVSTCAN
jgi:hypothetical protein